MSDLMDRAVIGMPFDMAMRSHLSRLQFYNRAQAILAERDALLAERDALRAAIFGGTDYATDLTNGNFVEMAQTTEAARIGALARAEKAEAERDALQGQLNDLRNGWAKSVKAHAALLAERDAAFAAGQRDMQERAIQDVAEWGCLFLGSGENVTVDVIDDLRDLPIKHRP